MPDSASVMGVTVGTARQHDARASVPGSRNDSRWWDFYGQTVPSSNAEIVRVHISGESHDLRHLIVLTFASFAVVAGERVGIQLGLLDFSSRIKAIVHEPSP